MTMTKMEKYAAGQTIQNINHGVDYVKFSFDPETELTTLEVVRPNAGDMFAQLFETYTVSMKTALVPHEDTFYVQLTPIEHKIDGVAPSYLLGLHAILPVVEGLHEAIQAANAE